MSVLEDDRVDDQADQSIAEALSIEKPQSFILYAGAGSGKTSSLKKALEHVKACFGDHLKRRGRKVGVITYTNAARDEILRRVKFDPLFDVATIHSFAWALISSHNEDIKKFLESRLPGEINELKLDQSKAKSQATKIYAERTRKIQSKQNRLERLPSITKFNYNPDGDNFTKDSLSHNEVIEIAAEFIVTKPALKNIIIGRYPFLLIDESQDTLLPFIDALLAFEEEYQGRFALGLFGDMMQRIYTHGKRGLADVIPDRWLRPEKIMNHRSRERIIHLANAIRSEDDRWEQRPRSDKSGGFATVYVLPTETEDRLKAEDAIRADLAERTGDPDWVDVSKVKMLTLEHHMAAYRLGFLEMFDAIDKVSSYRTSFRDGTLPPIRLFSDQVLPLIDAHLEGDQFSLMALLKAYSPLVSKHAMLGAGEKARGQLKTAQNAIDKLGGLFADGGEPTFGAVLSSVAETGLLEIPDVLQPFTTDSILDDLLELEDFADETMLAWKDFLKSPFSQIRVYRDYVAGLAPFDTHQGVKGLQFPRVMVIADDAANRFRAGASYEKLFGAILPSPADKKNQDEGKETQIEKTRRLLYVTCTRAEESLALVAYTENPDAVAKRLIDSKWFKAEEVKNFANNDK